MADALSLEEQIAAWQGQDWPAIIDTHTKWYRNNEQKQFDTALSMYQGKYWSQSLPSFRGPSQYMIQFNLIFAIVESAVSAMIPKNMRYTVDELQEELQWTQSSPEKLLERLARRGKWREEGILALTDAVLFGRWWLKTTLSGDMPTVRSVRAQHVFFDLAARRPDDLSYIIECVPKTAEQLQKDAEAGLIFLPSQYKGPHGLLELRKRAQAYPAWMSSGAHQTAGSRWIMCYEVYDRSRKEFTLWMEDYKDPLCIKTGEEFWDPWTLGNLNVNSEDCRGLSEVQLVQDLVGAINRLLIYVHSLVRRQSPVTLYDKGILGDGDVSAIEGAEPGSFVGVQKIGDAPLAASFFPGPTPDVPPDLMNLMNKFEQIVSYVSALSDAARGQVVGARTATELALIESQQATRIASRVERYHQSWCEAGSKALLLDQKLPLDKLPDLYESIHHVVSNAVENNRAVIQEKFQPLLNYINSRPQSFDLNAIDELFCAIFDLPKGILIPPEEQAAAQAPPGMPPGMPPGPVPESEEAIPEPIGAEPAQVATGKAL